MPLRLPKLDKTMPIVGLRLRDPQSGRMVEHEAVPTPAMQRFWQSAVIRSDTGAEDATTKVSQMDHNIYPQRALSNPPTQEQLQQLSDALSAIAERMTR